MHGFELSLCNQQGYQDARTVVSFYCRHLVVPEGSKAPMISLRAAWPVLRDSHLVIRLQSLSALLVQPLTLGVSLQRVVACPELSKFVLGATTICFLNRRPRGYRQRPLSLARRIGATPGISPEMVKV